MKENFLIIKLSSLGDIIHTLPAFSALRRRFPGSTITWAVEENGKEILDLIPGLDKIAVVDRKKWRKSANDIRQKERTALDFQGLVKSAFLAYLSRSRRRIGFHKKNLREPLASLFYTEKIDYVDESDVHVISKNLRLLRPLGIKDDNYEFPLLLPAEVVASVDAKLAEAGFLHNKKLIVYNLGAAWETKRWFPEKWEELIKKIQFEGSSPLLLWGNEEEKNLALQVHERTGVLLSPFLTIKEVLALIKKAALLVSGDTFALQAACALSTPVVGLFGPTNPRRNGPFRPSDRVVFHKLDCNPCYKKTCSTLDCLKALKVEDAVEAIKEAWESHE
ncbi:MAG: glycosyltransferase family 9 protein [Clostridiales bacterium]|nr:glycosyltransferase family 9 protein [Clostridiales bacterium]